jgi:pimeloyl-ACP methyl ester carboxylesterase
MLKEKIRSVRDLTGKNDVILIGHSMGGLVARRYRQTYAEKDGIKVRAIATLGTPLAGTPVAYLGAWIAPAPKQMLPGSSFIDGQQNWAGTEKDSTEYLHIGSNADLLVPEDYAVDGHEKNMTSLSVSDTGHVGLTMSEKVGKILKDFVCREIDKTQLV